MASVSSPLKTLGSFSHLMRISLRKNQIRRRRCVPVWRLIARPGLLARAAEVARVARPARRLWPAKSMLREQWRIPDAFTIKAMAGSTRAGGDAPLRFPRPECPDRTGGVFPAPAGWRFAVLAFGVMLRRSLTIRASGGLFQIFPVERVPSSARKSAAPNPINRRAWSQIPRRRAIPCLTASMKKPVRHRVVPGHTL